MNTPETNAPKNYRFSREHTWAYPYGENTVRIGISQHAQAELNDIVFVDTPKTGTPLIQGQVFCRIESIKTVSDVYSPVTGKIININPDIDANPGLINKDPYACWLVEAETDISSLSSLMTEEQYRSKN